MITALMRRDPVRQGWLRALLMQTLLVINVIGIQLRIAYTSGLSHQGVMIGLIWLMAGFAMLSLRYNHRGTAMDMGLPIPASRIWLAHLLVTALQGLIMVTASVVAVLLIGAVLSTFMAHDLLLGVTLRRSVLPLIAGVLLLAVLLSSRHGSRLKFRKSFQEVLIGTGLVLGVGALVVLVFHVLPWLAILVLLATVLIARRAHAAVPPMLEMPDDNDQPRNNGSATVVTNDTDDLSRPLAAGGWRTTLQLFFIAIRCTSRGPGTHLVVAPMIMAVGSLLGGALTDSSGDEVLRFTMIMMTAYMMLAFIIPQTSRMFMLDGLPIGRNLMLAALVLPTLLYVSAGFGIGRVYTTYIKGINTGVSYTETDGHYYARVPISFCWFTWSDDIPDNSVADGETHEAWRQVVCKGLPLYVYSPFSTPPGSSPDFVSAQLSKAVAHVYGMEISPAEIASRFLVTLPDGQVRPAPEAGSFLEAFPELETRSSGPVFIVLLLFVCVFWAFGLNLYFRQIHVGMNVKGRKLRLLIGLGVLMVFHMAQYVLAMAGVLELWLVPGLWKFSIRSMTEALPGGTLTVWLLCAVGLGLCWRITLSAFRRVEFNAYEEEIGLTLS
jgi:hypothetical protein